MKLELKHLAAYLPYGLKVLHTKKNMILIISGIYFETNKDEYFKYRLLNWEHIVLSNEAKPILRPLSDLTKEIEVNGGFVPKERLDQSCLTLFYPTEKLTEIHGIMSAPYIIIIHLLEWHFDVFGLIKAGLAIDINTIK